MNRVLYTALVAASFAGSAIAQDAPFYSGLYDPAVRQSLNQTDARLPQGIRTDEQHHRFITGSIGRGEKANSKQTTSPTWKRSRDQHR